jgi:UDPglucose--hexose-1-phosphate uridylyltransferase
MVDTSKPHRRCNPLTGEWILVSPHRTKRPWKGAIELQPPEKLPEYDPSCYLCPGNPRASGQINPEYTSAFVFTNDHAALLPNVGNEKETEDDLFISRQESGTSRVICYSPSHERTMAELSVGQIETVVATWKKEYEEIGADPDINYVQIFENKGAMMGASNPHPHCQIWANQSIPTIPQKEQDHQRKFLTKHGKGLLRTYLIHELQKQIRVIAQNKTFVVLVPFWATWPYETMILPKKHMRSLSDFSKRDEHDLADILKSIARAYDCVFNVSFPYSMGLHQKPTDGRAHDEWQFHIHFYPPLLRSATVKKYYVGYELMAEGQRDITPEAAAKTLHGLI